MDHVQVTLVKRKRR